MTFDDGIITIYTVTNGAENGDLPEKNLTKNCEFYFHEETLGISRYYEALKSNQLIERVVDVPDEGVVSINDIATIDTDPIDSNQYIIRMVQRTLDEEGLKILRLSLERNGEEYEIIE